LSKHPCVTLQFFSWRNCGVFFAYLDVSFSAVVVPLSQRQQRVLKKSFPDLLLVVFAVAAGLFALLAFLIYPKAFNYPFPSPIVLLAYVPIALAGVFFALRGALPVALLASFIVGVFGVRQGSLGINSFWWQTSSLFLLFGLMVGSGVSVLRQRTVKEPAKVQAASPRLDTSLLNSLVSALKLRDHATQSHSEWVAQNAFVVGRELGLAIPDLETLYWAALLHDLGKTSLPKATLLKASSLSEAEYAEVKRHPDYGAALLLSLSPTFTTIAEIIKHHHERWDGSGYPQGLARHSIPRLSRIVAVVDVFEALTSVRPYRSPLPANEALQYLEQGAGRDFDPEVARTFVACFQRGEIRSQGKTTVTKTTELGVRAKETVGRKT
jgi:HD-GYP domain-containing protein (c-di-GMP phosphodiesterase class II)